jgi:hypothetical protein
MFGQPTPAPEKHHGSPASLRRLSEPFGLEKTKKTGSPLSL